MKKTTINMVAAEGEVKINPKLIPDEVLYVLAMPVIEKVNAYFEQPGVVEEFERWREERKKKRLGA